MGFDHRGAWSRRSWQLPWTRSHAAVATALRELQPRRTCAPAVRAAGRWKSPGDRATPPRRCGSHELIHSLDLDEDRAEHGRAGPSSHRRRRAHRPAPEPAAESETPHKPSPRVTLTGQELPPELPATAPAMARRTLLDEPPPAASSAPSLRDLPTEHPAATGS